MNSSEWATALAAEASGSSSPASVRVGTRNLAVDKTVSGPLCNDHWSGTVYVTCDVRVAEWAEEPTFLRECDLKIEPGTVVYVAAHNNTAYYQGCACHTGTVELP